MFENPVDGYLKKKKKLYCILFPFFNKKKRKTKVLVLILRKC